MIPSHQTMWIIFSTQILVMVSLLMICDLGIWVQDLLVELSAPEHCTEDCKVGCRDVQCLPTRYLSSRCPGQKQKNSREQIIRNIQTCNLALLQFCLAIHHWNFPRPQTGPRIAIFWEKRVSGPKNPHFPSPSHGPEKGVFDQKIPIFPAFPCRKKKGGILAENPPFPGRVEMALLDPETLFPRKWGFRALSGVGESQIYHKLVLPKGSAT